MDLKIIRTGCTDPYKNLALEEQLTTGIGKDEIILYIWQNANTIVIGRNQNPWRECDVEAIRRDGVRLARRLSGGGAVYHDLGNLNFTFIASDELFDVEKQTDVILLTCRIMGVDAKKTGRNDLTAEGRKFSGHAYYSSNGCNYHHGTLMVEVDEDAMGKYLRPSDDKLRSRGVESVRSGVTNLVEHMTDGNLLILPVNIIIESVKGAMLAAAEKIYGTIATHVAAPEISRELIDKYSSEEWRLGTKIPFEKSIIKRFEWGETEVQLAMKGEYIDKVKIYSDALETEVFSDLEKLLTGCKYNASEIGALKAKRGVPGTAEEILDFIADEI